MNRALVLAALLAAALAAASLAVPAAADDWAEFDEVDAGSADAATAAAAAAAAAAAEPALAGDVNDGPAAAAQAGQLEEEELDEDEFVVEPAAAKPRAQAAAAKQPPTPQQPAEQQQQQQQQRGSPKTWQDYYPELCALVLAVLYLLNFWHGRSQNDVAANAWYAAFSGLFEQQFAVPGAYNGEEEGARLIKDSQSCYKFYASGRRNCDGVMATLDMVKRHDLLSMLLAQIDMERTRDQLTLEAKMDDRAMPPVVFAVAPRKRLARVKAENLDLEQFSAAAPMRALGGDLVAVADNPELAGVFLTADVRAVLEESADLLHCLHFTDRFAGAEKLGEKVVRLVVNLPKAGEMHRLQRVTELFLHMVDRVAVTKLGAQVQARAEKLRREAVKQQFKNDHEARQEAAQRRKDEARRKEEEAWASMTDDQKRKKEEQDYKKQLRKRSKMKMMR